MFNQGTVQFELGGLYKAQTMYCRYGPLGSGGDARAHTVSNEFLPLATFTCSLRKLNPREPLAIIATPPPLLFFLAVVEKSKPFN